MHPIFHVQSSDIQALDDKQARELVARLCKAELHAQGIGDAAVTWGGDQRAADGGVDVRVDLQAGIDISGYVPKGSTIYQVKAEAFNPAKISKEMAPKGILRPSISALVDKAGAYVIVSTKDNTSDSSLLNRKEAMANCLTTDGLADKICLDFYDSRKIADWAESHPAIVVWLTSELKKPLTGWQPHGTWAYREKTRLASIVARDDEYLLDGKAKVFSPQAGKEMPILEAIDALRGDLGKEQASVRLVGLSGVGKTRLAQALFDDRISTSQPALNKEMVIYTDLADDPNPQPSAMLEALVQTGSAAIVIVDNCGQGTHQQLTAIVQRAASELSLLTIEYDIRDDSPEGTSCYRLAESSGALIEQILERHYSALSALDRNTISQFSGGNARIALALASTSNTSGELGRLTDDALFLRLFVQKNEQDKELQRCAEAASLLYSFDAEGEADTSELAMLSAIAEVTISTFFRNIAELERRGLLQKRGKWRAVLPHAIANRLASCALRFIHPKLMISQLVKEAPPRVARSFSRRLGYLHKSESAKQIVGDWLKPGGILGDASQLDELGQMFINIAPVDQRAALDVLLRAIKTDDSFTSLDHPNRHDFAHLLRSLAYEAALFDDAAKGLLAFALKETKGDQADPVCALLKSLFYCQLSGTLALPEQRAAFVKALALSGDEARSRLALDLLRAALQSHSFTSHYNFDFGAHMRGFGWEPEDCNALQNWYSLFINCALEFGKQPTAIAAKARSLLGDVFSGLWIDADMWIKLTHAAKELAAIDGWPEGWVAVRTTIGRVRRSEENLSDDSLAALQGLDQQLTPKDLLEKIRVTVLSRDTFRDDLGTESDEDSETAWNDRAYDEARKLGRATLDEPALDDLVPYLELKEPTAKVYSFGRGVGEVAISTESILERVKRILETTPPGKLSPLFIRGLLVGWHEIKPSEAEAFLDQAVNDATWLPLFPGLQAAVGLGGNAYNRLRQCLEQNKTPSQQFMYLGMGSAKDNLTVTQIASLLNLLAKKPEHGLEIACDVLQSVVFYAKEKDENYRSELQAYCLWFIREMDCSSIAENNGNGTYHLVSIIEFGLLNASLRRKAIEAMSNLIQYERANPRGWPRRIGRLLAPFFRCYPLDALDAGYFKDSEGYGAAVDLLSTEYGSKNGDSAVYSAPETALIEWCQRSPDDRSQFAARTCQLFQTEESEFTVISNIAKQVLALACDKKAVLEFFVGRFSPGFSHGSYAATLRRGLEFLDQFKRGADAELQALIDKTKADLSTKITDQERREHEREKAQTAGFEW